VARSITRDKLDQIERELQLKLPRFYRQFILNFQDDRGVRALAERAPG
jgi:hypothetical protein